MTGSRREASDVAVLFDRHRLQVARELRGLSQVELARAVATVRAASISQFEQGHAKPSPLTIERFAVALNVPINFFATSGRADSAGSTYGFFRSLRSTPPRARKRALAFMEIAREIVYQLETVVRLPDLDLPEAQESIGPETAVETIEHYADLTRKQWNIPAGPVDNVVLELERHGIVVTRIRVDHEKIDAFSVPFAGRPIVALGSDKNVRDRSRFDGSHELGHLVLHRESQAGEKIIEQQAHQFAAAFLMPADDIRGQLPRTADWATLLKLKAQWHVSIASLLKRSLTLGIMSDRTYVQALKTMSARDWRKVEPGLLGPPEEPQLLRRALEVASEVGVSITDIADRAGLPLTEADLVIGAQQDSRPSVQL